MDQLAPKRQKTGLCLTHNPVFCQTAAVPDEVVIASMFGPWVVSGLDGRVKIFSHFSLQALA